MIAKQDTSDTLKKIDQLGIVNIATSGDLDQETLSLAIKLTEETYSQIDFDALAKEIDEYVGRFGT